MPNKGEEEGMDVKARGEKGPRSVEGRLGERRDVVRRTKSLSGPILPGGESVRPTAWLNEKRGCERNSKEITQLHREGTHLSCAQRKKLRGAGASCSRTTG